MPHGKFSLKTVVAALLVSALGLCALPAQATTLAVSEKGQALGALLDRFDVEKRWLRIHGEQPRFLVNWQTGLAEGNSGAQPDCHKLEERAKLNNTFCSSFVSAVVRKVGLKLAGKPIPFLYPYNGDTKKFGEHGQCAPRDYLSNYLQAWLRGEEVKLPKKWKYTAPANEGWKAILTTEKRSALERAQRLANRGHLVIASYAFRGTERKPGHIAVLRPAEKTVELVEKEGPQILNVGWKNYPSVSFRTAFEHHSCEDGKFKAYCGEEEDGTPKGAWESMKSRNPKVLFFYYPLQ